MTRTRFGIARRTRARLPLLCLVALAILAIALPSTGAAATSDVWKAKVGTGGANGTATLTAPAAAAGTLRLVLKALTPSSAYAVKIVKGTCTAPGAAIWSAGTQTSTSAGKITKSIAVPVAKMTAIRTAAAAGPVAIRVGAGSKLRCGPFTGGPPVIPSPTPEPSLVAKVAVTTMIGDNLVDISADDSSIWTVDAIYSKAYKVNPTSATMDATVDYSGGWLNLTLGSALGEGSLWIAATDLFQNGGTVVRIKQGTTTVDQRMYVPGLAIAVTTGGGSVWVAAAAPSALLRIDPAKNQVAQSISLPEAPSDVAFGGGSVWLAGKTSVLRVNAATSAVTTIDLGADVNGIAFGEGSVWATVDKTGTASAKVVRIDSGTGAVIASIDVSGSPWDVAVGSGYVWVAPDEDANPYAIVVSAASNRVVGSVTLPAPLWAVAVRGRSAWFAGTTALGGMVARVDW